MCMWVMLYNFIFIFFFFILIMCDVYSFNVQSIINFLGDSVTKSVFDNFCCCSSKWWNLFLLLLMKIPLSSFNVIGHIQTLMSFLFIFLFLFCLLICFAFLFAHPKRLDSYWTYAFVSTNDQSIKMENDRIPSHQWHRVNAKTQTKRFFFSFCCVS